MAASTKTLYAACIARAAQRLGGYEALALRVGVPAKVLKYWADGNGTGAYSVFLKIVDILNERV